MLTRATTPAALFALIVALAYGVGAWMVMLHAGSVSHLPFAIHWLRDSTVALPTVAAAVLLSTALLRRHLAATGRALSGLHRAALTSVTAAAASLAVAAGDPLYAALFGEHQHIVDLPVPLHVARDTILSLPVAFLVAAVMIAFAARRRHPQADFKRRITAVLSGTAIIASTVTVLVPASPAAAAEPGNPCPDTAPVKTFDVESLDVDIPLNRFGDHDPLGKMYVLSSKVDDVRRQEKSQKVTPGLKDDAIQPLAIRANEGDCVQINFTNHASGGGYGIHIDGLSYQVGSSGDAIGENVASDVSSGDSTTYRYYIPNDTTLEGAHYLHPGPGNRDAVAHGLFGALIVEPPGSTYLDASTGEVLDSGWEARIVPAGAPAFREYALLFHEVGNEKYRIKTADGHEVPLVDPISTSYRPDSKAINYRSEAFYNRLLKAPEQESQGYGSYTFGDVATPMPRAYLGDPTKFRLIHAGGEMFHVFHMHGGGIRWRFNPKADPTYNYADTGLNKDPETKLSPSARLDSQSMGPGEVFNLEIEGGAGGVQNTAGEFLFHCHIAEHYVSGMWSYWRVYNTFQPDLAPLPDRDTPQLRMPEAVNSAELIGRTMPDGTTLTAQNIDQWIRPQLPTQGKRLNDEDASVWDWKIDKSNPDKPLYLGEPEDTTPWPNSFEGVPGHLNSYPVDRFVGNRPEILFHPETGRPAFPLLRTHVGVRPPFSPNGHSGAPYLGETADQAPTGSGPDPWANRPDGICPADSPVRHYNIVAINLPIQVTHDDVDQNGKIYVLAQDKKDILAGRKPAEPLAIRSNIDDCVAVTLTNEIPDTAQVGNFSKANIHIHHVQFDTQASDGVISGMSFEQTMRPYKEPDTQSSKLGVAAQAGDTTLKLADASKFRKDVWIAVGVGTNSIEVRQIKAIDKAASTVTLNKALDKNHGATQWASVEFTQYRWYPDVELDNIFFHDHVDGIHNFGHGLVGQLLVEPRGSKYLDPVTGEETNGAGTYTDIVTDNPLAPGLIDSSFRELALWEIDENPITDSTFNLKAEPWGDRLATGPENQVFNSHVHGDPVTPLPRAYPGDPFAIRTINVGPSVDTFHLDGHRFYYENRYTDHVTGEVESTPVNTIHYGISERFTLMLQGGAGGPQHEPGDYLYYNGIGRRFRQGAWGILRVLPHRVPDLQVLPGTNPPVDDGTPLHTSGGLPPIASGPGNPCPATADNVNFNVSAVDLPNGQDGRNKAFVPTSQAQAVASGDIPAEPLVLHVAAGSCVNVHLNNLLHDGAASFHVDQLLRTIESSGINVGYNPEQTAPRRGGSRDYRFYADSDRLGTALISDYGMAGDGGGVTSDTGPDGLYGAINVAPKGATFTDLSGNETKVGTQVDVRVPDAPDYRDFTLAFADQDPQLGANFMPYPLEAEGPALVNYESASLASDTDHAFAGKPATPMLMAHAGDQVRVHALIAPGSEQMHSFNLGGLGFPVDPRITHANQISTFGMGPSETFEARVTAGGTTGATGDYFYGDLRRPFTDAGMWGIFRTLGAANCAIESLDGGACTTGVGGLATNDVTVPTVEAPALSLLQSSIDDAGMVPVKLTWSGDDPDSRVASYTLQQSVDGGAFSDVALASELATSNRLRLAPGHSYRFQVSVTDGAGNTSEFAAGPEFTLNVDEEDSAAVTYSGAWSNRAQAGASGGSVASATTRGATATFSFDGTGAEWVATKGRNRGKARVILDGAAVGTFDLYRATEAKRRIVFAASNLDAGSHTLEVKVLGTKRAASRGTRVDVDSFVSQQ